MTRRRFGNIRQLPGGRFQARWTGPDGHQHKAPDTFATHALAEKWLASVRTDVDRGEWIDPRHGQVTFAEIAGQWRENLVHLRPSTLARDLGYLERYVLPAFGERPIGQIMPSEITAWVSRLRARQLAAATIRDALRVCRAVLEVAVRDGKRRDNPARDIKPPRLERKEMRILTPDQIHALAEVIDSRYAELVIAGCWTGLRMGELVALTPADVDLARRRVTVTRNIVEVSGQIHHSHVKTNAGRRAVPLVDVAADALEHAIGRTRHHDDLLFTAPSGGFVRLTTWRARFWKPAVVAIGQPLLRPYDMRHTAISLWMLYYGDVKAISTWAGHTSTSFTLDRYGHLADTHAENFLAKLNAAHPVRLGEPAPVVRGAFPLRGGPSDV